MLLPTNLRARITYVETKGALPGHKGGTRSETVIAESTPIWMRKSTRNSQTPREARDRTVRQRKAWVAGALEMRLGATVVVGSSTYAVVDLDEPESNSLTSEWTLVLEKVA